MPSIAQLKYIVALHQHGHFGKAAEACGVSQPTLSGQISKVEEELGITLFVRQQKPVVATDKGSVVIKRAEAVLEAHERLMVAAQGEFETITGDLTLAVIPTLAPYILPWFLRRFAEAYPKVNLTVVERTTEDTIIGLDRRRIDAGILATPLGVGQLEERVLFYDPFYLYAAAGESILSEREVDASGLAAGKLWLLDEGHCLRNQTLSLCDAAEGNASLSTVRFEAGSLETLRHLIDASEGYTLVPETYARLLPPERRTAQVRALTEPTPTRQISLVHLKTSWKTDIIEALQASIMTTLPRSLQERPKSVEVLPVRHGS